MGTPSSTLDLARIQPVSEELEPSGVKLLMCLLSGGSTRQSGCSAPVPGRPLSGTSSPSLSVSPTSSSTLPRAPPTATQSRRRTNWSVWPSPTDIHGSKMVLAGFLGVEQETFSNWRLYLKISACLFKPAALPEVTAVFL